VGLRLVSDLPAELRILSTEIDSGTAVLMHVSPDTAVRPVIVTPLSATPSDQPFTAGAHADFVIAAAGPPPPTADVVRIGGVPGRRAYFRFDLPASVVDSAAVVRATLILTQRPLRNSPRAGDTVQLYTLPLVASEAITDIRTAVAFAAGPGAFGIDSVALAPRDSGTRTIDIAGLVRSWRLAGPTVPRALVLTLNTEAVSTPSVDFFSREAAPSLRPRLRLTYVPRTQFGLP
jgi:hypothetical protein